jgi:hypothetical protein
MLTAVVNLTAMTVTIAATGLGPHMFGDKGLSPQSIVTVLVLLVLFAAFFSAVLLLITSFARSFKEAQAYLIPLMLLALAPGMLSLMDIQLTGALKVAPLVNVVLLAREMAVSSGKVAGYDDFKPSLEEFEAQAVEQIIRSATVICATTTGLDSEILGRCQFDLAVIDEAAQSTEPGCWIPLPRCHQRRRTRQTQASWPRH